MERKQNSIKWHAHEMAKLLSQAKARRILLQLPEGLRWKAAEIAEALEKYSYRMIVSGARCFGACDLPLKEAEAAGVDAILHAGHKPFYRKIESRIPVVYYDWPVHVELDEDKAWQEMQKLTEDTIGIITSVQYTEAARRITLLLEKKGKKAVFGGYVLGCWTEPAESIAKKGATLLFVGSGAFHPLGFECRYVFDVEQCRVRDISREQMSFAKKRFARIAKARDCRSFGILVSSKPGQKELLGNAYEIKRALEKKNKKAVIVIMDEINAEALGEMKVDAFINTACPRLADDEWKKPLVNAEDMPLLLENGFKSAVR